MDPATALVLVAAAHKTFHKAHPHICKALTTIGNQLIQTALTEGAKEIERRSRPKR